MKIGMNKRENWPEKSFGTREEDEDKQKSCKFLYFFFRAFGAKIYIHIAIYNDRHNKIIKWGLKWKGFSAAI